MKITTKLIKKASLIIPLLAICFSMFFSVVPVSAEGEVWDKDTCNCGKPSQVMSLECGAVCAGPEKTTCLFGTDDAGEKCLFNKIIDTALFLIGAISVVMLIYGGIRYTISGGKQESVTAAKNTILYAIVGIIIAMLAYAIIEFVVGVLG